MHVVFHPIYDEGFAGCFVYQVADDAEKLLAPIISYDRIAVFYGEDELQVDLVIRVGHVRLFLLVVIWAVPTALVLFYGSSFRRVETRRYKMGRAYGSANFHMANLQNSEMHL